MSNLIATAAENPNTLPIIANNPSVVGVIVIVCLLLCAAMKTWKPAALLVALFVIATVVSSQATGGIK